MASKKPVLKTTTKKVSVKKPTVKASKAKTKAKVTRKKTLKSFFRVGATGAITKKGILISFGILLFAGLTFTAYMVWQNMGANATGSSRYLGLKYGKTAGGKNISARGYACKASTGAVKGTIVINSGTSGERLAPSLQYKTPSGVPQYPKGSTIDSRAGQQGTVFTYANSVNSTTAIGLVLQNTNIGFGSFTVSSLPRC